MEPFSIIDTESRSWHLSNALVLWGPILIVKILKDYTILSFCPINCFSTLPWITFLNILQVFVCLCAQTCPTPQATLWTLTCQAPLSMEFSWQEHWSGLPFPTLEDLPNPGIEVPAPRSSTPPRSFTGENSTSVWLYFSGM